MEVCEFSAKISHPSPLHKNMKIYLTIEYEGQKFESESLSFESAQEQLGKLERYISKLKEEDTKQEAEEELARAGQHSEEDVVGLIECYK